MAKQGRATHRSIQHGVEESPQWVEDKEHNQFTSKQHTWVAIHNSDVEFFESDISALRDAEKKGAESNWGYLVSDDIYSHLKNATGAQFADKLTKHHNELTTHYDLSYRKNKSDGKCYFQAQKRKEQKGRSFLERVTVDASPEISRAFQISLEKISQLSKDDADEKLMEMRVKLEFNLTSIIKKFEEIYTGVKVVGAAWHVSSGQLHCDLWAHGCYEREATIGKKERKKILRMRDPSALCHYGPGSGIVAWDRHVRVLGEEADSVAPATVLEVEKACDLCAFKAKQRDRAGSENRDIRIHRALDSILEKSIDEESLKIASTQYKEHLKQVYAAAATSENIDTKWLEKIETERELLENQQIERDLQEEILNGTQEELSTRLSILEANEDLREEESHKREQRLGEKEFSLLFDQQQLEVSKDALANEQAKQNLASINLAVKQENKAARLDERETAIKEQEHKIKAFNVLEPLLKKLLPVLKSVHDKLTPVLRRNKVSTSILNRIEKAISSPAQIAGGNKKMDDAPHL